MGEKFIVLLFEVVGCGDERRGVFGWGFIVDVVCDERLEDGFKVGELVVVEGVEGFGVFFYLLKYVLVVGVIVVYLVDKNLWEIFILFFIMFWFFYDVVLWF